MGIELRLAGVEPGAPVVDVAGYYIVRQARRLEHLVGGVVVGIDNQGAAAGGPVARHIDDVAGALLEDGPIAVGVGGQ